MVKRSHVKMIFRFSGMNRAYKFEYALNGCGGGVSGVACYDAALGWHVITDSRCLEYAARLLPYIYETKAGRA